MLSKRWLKAYLFGCLLAFTCRANVLANPWEAVDEPSLGEVTAMGSYANGCLAGAKALPLSGEGFQVIRTARNRYYGHPQLIAFITDLAQSFQQSQQSDLLIADMSMPRGGNFSHGHSSHQIGLDVDIWLQLADKTLTETQRESPEPLDLVDQKTFSLDSPHWQPQQTQMLQLAAEDERVARIFVSPVIKLHLCDMKLADDTWLTKVRPWWGHTYHMHVRLHCPADDDSCIDQAPITKGNGCQELNWWRQQMTQTKTKTKPSNKKLPAKPKKPKVKPKQCKRLLTAES
ncbi:penicillin-insensitive murein endopeptidase [Shewanella gelidimarina]|uniref:penicillin-insensitive murein endopeptidase n=1 Tax=Shewanella gelidimarina TaxID=56813 RepID=UPI00200D23C5|nr:penicillin-insensitive murein endopeptidase [Shewanella gelidimarina]